jgi:hypothetical protein
MNLGFLRIFLTVVAVVAEDYCSVLVWLWHAIAVPRHCMVTIGVLLPITPSDFHLFGPVKCTCLARLDLKQAVTSCLLTLDRFFFVLGCKDNCLNVSGDYLEFLIAYVLSVTNMPYILGIKCLLYYFLKRPSIYERVTVAHTAAKFQFIQYFRLYYDFFLFSCAKNVQVGSFPRSWTLNEQSLQC